MDQRSSEAILPRVATALSIRGDQTTPQLSRMLRVESIAITLLGSLLGLALGVGVAAAIQSAMVDNGLNVRDIPVLQLVAAVAAAMLFGVLAAVWPSRRASRLNVLRAIAAE